MFFLTDFFQIDEFKFDLKRDSWGKLTRTSDKYSPPPPPIKVRPAALAIAMIKTVSYFHLVKYLLLLTGPSLER